MPTAIAINGTRLDEVRMPAEPFMSYFNCYAYAFYRAAIAGECRPELRSAPLNKSSEEPLMDERNLSRTCTILGTWWMATDLHQARSPCRWMRSLFAQPSAGRRLSGLSHARIPPGDDRHLRGGLRRSACLEVPPGTRRDVVGPGVHFKIPIIQRFQVEPTKDTTLDLEPQVIQLSDELVYEVGAKVVYQIVDLRKAVVEVDNLVEGLKNRLVIIVQNVVKAQDRYSIRDMARMVDEVKQALRPVEQQWGVKVHEFGFSTFSPTPETLEITQLQKLANEKLPLYRQFHDEQKLSPEAAVSLISGAVMALSGHRRMSARTAVRKFPPRRRPPTRPAGDTSATGDSTPDVAE